MREEHRLTDLSADRIRGWLPEELRGAPVVVFPVLESSNRTCKQLALEGAPHGTVVLADAQTAGRGRLGRSFFSPAGTGLYFSLLLRSEEAPEKILQVTSLAAVAVCRAIASVTGLECEIKWVNDIYLRGRKLCGILAEGIVDPNRGQLSGVVLGIGINCGNRREDFPEELQEIVTSLWMETGEVPDRSRLAAELYRCLLEILAPGEILSGMEEYRRRSYVLDKEVRFFRGEDTWEGRAEAITAEGHLIVRLDSGEQVELSTGEISVRVK